MQLPKGLGFRDFTSMQVLKCRSLGLRLSEGFRVTSIVDHTGTSTMSIATLMTVFTIAYYYCCYHYSYRCFLSSVSDFIGFRDISVDMALGLRFHGSSCCEDCQIDDQWNACRT